MLFINHSTLNRADPIEKYKTNTDPHRVACGGGCGGGRRQCGSPGPQKEKSITEKSSHREDFFTCKSIRMNKMGSAERYLLHFLKRTL